MAQGGTVDMGAVMEKVGKLKALADAGGTEAEAAAAVAALQRLMIRHDISEYEVERAGKQERSRYEVRQVQVPAAEWRRTLLDGIARTSLVYCATDRSHSGLGAFLVGETQHVTAVIGMYEYLAATLDRLAQEAFWEMPYHERKQTTMRRFGNAFRTGATRRIIERLMEAFQQETAGSTGSALVVRTQDEGREALFQQTGLRSSTHVTRQTVSDANAFARGVEAGGSISLAKQLD